MKTSTLLSFFSAVSTLAACAPDGAFVPLKAESSLSQSLTTSEGTPAKVPATAPLPAPMPATGPSTLKICSKLSFPTALAWPASVSTAVGRDALKLAMNISGSFEGSTGWVNLTNDFDDQGLSMGLLNQTLNTGSLEPLLVQMKDGSLPALKSSMSRANFEELLAMLREWEGVASLTAKPQPNDDVVDEDAPLSKYDIDLRSPQAALKAAANRNAVAAQWARETIYDSAGKFLASWKTDLTAMASSAEYISLQVAAAAKLHAKAIAYQKQFNAPSLRAYLFFFDVIVQNGNFYAADIADYGAWLKLNAKADEATRLKQLLFNRLRHVRAEYVADVKARKTSIIDGKGTVHGSSRKLESEYCFDRLATL